MWTTSTKSVDKRFNYNPSSQQGFIMHCVARFGFGSRFPEASTGTVHLDTGMAITAFHEKPETLLRKFVGF